MKKKLIQGLSIFVVVGVISFLLYDFIALKLTNIYKNEICLREYCIQKPHDWLPLIVKKSGKSYYLGEFLNNDMPEVEMFLHNEGNGIILKKEKTKIILEEFIEKRKSKSKLFTEKEIQGKKYFIMNNGALVVVLFPSLNMTFSITGKLDNYDTLVKHLILTSSKVKT